MRLTHPTPGIEPGGWIEFAIQQALTEGLSHNHNNNFMNRIPDWAGMQT